MREERGLGKSGLIGFQNPTDEEDDEAAEEAMRRDWRYEEMEAACLAQGDKEGAKVAREKRAAGKRLHRVEVIYVSSSGDAELTFSGTSCQSCKTAQLSC